MKGRVIAFMLAAVAVGSPTAIADPVADFYKGKQIRGIVRTATGGDYDLYTRLLSRHWGRHIPGNPTFVVQNMPGGGGILAANFMYDIAPKDGTVLGIVSQGLALDQALGLSPSLKAQLKEFGWIANIVQSNQLLVVYKTAPAKTIEEAKKTQVLIGTTGAGSASTQYPAFYNNVIGTKFKLVTGYISGTQIDLAMERGEVHGRGTNPYSSYMASKPDWIPSGTIIPLVQAGIEKEPELPNVPLIMDLETSPDNRLLLQMMARASSVGRPLATTPGVPAERLTALRTSFMEMLKDKEFITDANRSKLEIKPLSWEKTADIINGLLGAPSDVKERMKLALKPKPEEMIKTESGTAKEK